MNFSKNQQKRSVYLRGHNKHIKFGRVEKHTKDKRRLVGHLIQAHSENMRKWQKNGAPK